MSEKETYSTRELLRQHASDSADFRADMRAYMAKMDERFINIADKVDSHSDSIKYLDRAHNRQKGAIWGIGLLGGTGIVAAVKHYLGL